VKVCIVETRGKGRPKKTFSREQLDRAHWLLGRRQYPSRVATALRKKWPDLTLARAYKLIEEAQREVYEQFAGDGASPLAATYLALRQVMAAPSEKTRDRIAAASVIVKLLGMHKLIKGLQDAGDVDEFLAGVMQRQLARAGEKLVEPKSDAEKPE
jgi:hypothetical protein